MDDRGQMLLLSALAVCVCLILLSTYLTSVKETESLERAWPDRESIENVIWAQDAGLKDIAMLTGGYSWDRRQDLSNDFKKRADRLAGDISRRMNGCGVAFSFEYNETLAMEYAVKSNDGTLAGVGGIIVKKIGNEARAFGCAYDVSMTDGSSQYSLSRVACWD